MIFQYLQYALGYSTLEAGAAVVPQGLGIILSSVAADRTARRLGLGATGAIGLALVAGGFALLAVMTDVGSNYLALLPGLVVAGAGLGLASAAGTTSILSGAPEAAQGSASGVNNAAREIGGALGIAGMGSLLNSTYANDIDVSGLSGRAADAADGSIVAAQQVADGLGPRGAELAVSAQVAFVDEFHASLWLGVAALGLASVMTLVFGPRAGDVTLDVEELDPPPENEAARRHVTSEPPLAAALR